MPQRRITTFRIDEELIQGLRQIEERDGVLVSEQVRRAIKAWLQTKGVKLSADRKRAATRKRS